MNAARILVVGGGGREHALAWRLAASPQSEQVFVAPGNAGTAGEAKTTNIDIAADDIDGLARFAADQGIGLTVVGPEAPLVAGIVDRFRERGLAIVGPTEAAAALEGSKAFAKDFLARHDIPSAAYRTFDAPDPALAWIRERGAPLVIKADGLAAGKGVIIAADQATAEAAVRTCFEGAFGAAGARVVIEDLLAGEEASFIALVDGETIVPLASSQDHKTRDDSDQGPNTGGMGAYSPAPVVSESVHARIMTEVMAPTVRGMAAEGRPLNGFLYAGLMIAADGTPNVLEFNVRGGDPETEPILMRLASDAVDLFAATAGGHLGDIEPEWDPRPALAVVLAAGGYPAAYRKGDAINGLTAADKHAGCKVFHAGTRKRDGVIETAGGRVLCVTALGDDLAAARSHAYSATAAIDWPDVHYRRDIGHHALGHGDPQ